MRKATLFIAALAVCMLTACATQPQKQRTSSTVDQEYVSAVETKARGSRVKVYWLNPPRKSREEDDSS